MASRVKEKMGVRSDSKYWSAPLVWDEGGDSGDEQALACDGAMWSRAIAASANNLQLDRAALQYAVQEARKGMMMPTCRDVQKMTRVVWNILGAPRATMESGVESPGKNFVSVLVDSDWGPDGGRDGGQHMGARARARSRESVESY